MSDVKRQDGQEKAEQGAASQAKPLVLDYGSRGPRPMRKVLLASVAVVLAGGGVLLLVDATRRPLSGALRSTQLKWEERRKEADAVVAESDAAEARCATEDRERK